jgi:hypothetical protein
VRVPYNHSQTEMDDASSSDQHQYGGNRESNVAEIEQRAPKSDSYRGSDPSQDAHAEPLGGLNGGLALGGRYLAGRCSAATAPIIPAQARAGAYLPAPENLSFTFAMIPIVSP